MMFSIVAIVQASMIGNERWILIEAEALIGRQPGTTTLQRVIGSGTLGAVYLGQQLQPSRSVAVKVFLRLESLELQQQRAFLATFRDEMARVFALEHPNILPVYDYGDLDGLAYIVTPYVLGETLEEVLAHEGALPLQIVAICLQQIADALDYAHGRGVVHRDLKPANIFITPEKRVLVADFHLTSMLVEGNTAQMRLSKPGLLDYMSPELVIGKYIDKRADLYSLGAILYRMVTGATLFQGQTLMKVATKHLKMSPPSPRAARPDLPPAAEQVILKALAKDAADRFENAQDISLLFQQAINGSRWPRITSQPISPLPSIGTRFIGSNNPLSGSLAPANFMPGNPPSSNLAPVDAPFANPGSADVASSDTGARSFTPPLLFGPSWRTNSLPGIGAGQNGGSTGAMNLPGARTAFEFTHSSSASLPSIASSDAFTRLNGQPASRTASQELASTQSAVQANALTPAKQAPGQEAMASNRITWALPEIKQEDSGTTGTYKLTGPARIVNIPVAGQPGQYVTGILPSSQHSAGIPGLPAPVQRPVKHPLLQRLRVPIFVLAALLIVCGSVGFAYVHFSSSKRPGGSTITPAGTPNFSATASAQAQASVDANTILSDSLSQNIRSWPESSSGPFFFQFKNGAYHITNNDTGRVATAILLGENLGRPFVYTLTMDEIRGDDTSVNNESGMILRFNSQVKNGKQITTFYTFEVVNRKGGQYQFWMYDNSQGPSANPWKQLANHPTGSEFHQGQGPANSNTFRILVNGKNFTLIVNGKQVWSVLDSSLTSGQVGMLVNLKGTEVAFSNLKLTWS
jgi:serine/threonine protein kinase